LEFGTACENRNNFIFPFKKSLNTADKFSKNLTTEFAA
jgi:hypothetical protein